MKRFNTILSISILLVLSTGIIMSGCKKKSSTPDAPTFTVTSTTVQLQGGGEGLQFYGKCNNTDVKLTKATITDPIGAQTITYNLNGTYYVKGEIFMLEDANSAYTKETGTWSVVFIGNLTADGSSFSVGATITIAK